MLRIVNLEEIQSTLQGISRIIDLQAKRDSSFLEEVKQWLNIIETILINNKIPESGRIASLRGSIISAEIGVIPNGFTTRAHVTGSKLKNGVALDVIRQTSDILFTIIHKDMERLSEAERIMRQLISISQSKGLLQDTYHNLRSTEVLKLLWNKFSNDGDLAQGVVSIEGLVGPYDSLIILNRQLG
jgi:hypothetical protein